MLAAGAALFSLSCFAETSEELEDAAARLQYAFYTADAQSLQNVLRELEGYDVDERLEPLKSHHLAYGYWKLAQTQTHARRNGGSARDASGSAAKAVKTCIAHARAAREREPRLAEAYAIEAACDGMPSGLLGNFASGSCARSRALRTALSLDPQGPRVLLVEALCSPRDANDIARWRKVVEAFERAPPGSPGKPDWGHAEALAQLGAGYLQQGNAVAARDALERALVLAPDYADAQGLLAQAAASR